MDTTFPFDSTFHGAIVWAAPNPAQNSILLLSSFTKEQYCKAISPISSQNIADSPFLPEHPIWDISPNQRPPICHLLNIVKNMFWDSAREKFKQFQLGGELSLLLYLSPSVLALWQPSFRVDLCQKLWVPKWKYIWSTFLQTKKGLLLTNVTFLRVGWVGRALDRVISLRSMEHCQLTLS